MKTLPCKELGGPRSEKGRSSEGVGRSSGPVGRQDDRGTSTQAGRDFETDRQEGANEVRSEG